MLTIAYLANEFPSPVEPYVSDEIGELRRRGVRVVAGSVRNSRKVAGSDVLPEIVLLPLTPAMLMRGLWLCLRRWKRIRSLVQRAVRGGTERILQRAKALVHTLLGACYAAELQEFNIGHIHVHHGYIGSWIAMTASRLLGVEFSLTLHGSDLLLNGPYLDVKLKYCSFSVTVSDYNRRHILSRFPEIPAEKIVVSRLGVEVEDGTQCTSTRRNSDSPFTILSVGRLHPVKDHAFLIRACRELRNQGMDFRCFVAGEGPERRQLEKLIMSCGLEDRLLLLGHVPRDTIHDWYDRADVVVLTSRSEGIPLVLMEAMARGKVVLAPAITGIPELVTPGRTGFLYQPGSMLDFVVQLKWIYEFTALERRSGQNPPSAHREGYETPLGRIRLAARAQAQQKFNRRNNLAGFADHFLKRVASTGETVCDESLVLQ